MLPSRACKLLHRTINEAPSSLQPATDSPKVLGQVLADVARHLEHIDAGHREHLLQRRIRLDDTTLRQLVLLDVLPDLLRDLGARQRGPQHSNHVKELRVMRPKERR